MAADETYLINFSKSHWQRQYAQLMHLSPTILVHISGEIIG